MYTRYAKVCHGTKRVPCAELVLKGRMHVSRMRDNPLFPEPRPSLAEVALACDELDIASRVYDFNRGRMDLVNRDEAREHLRRLIIMLANYVQGKARGERSIALAAGFETKRKRSPSVMMRTAGDVRTDRTVFPGRIDLRWNAVKGRKMYAVYYTEGDPALVEGWQLLAQTSKNHFIASGLNSDTTYSFRVSALGALGYGPVSDIAMATAA